MLQWAAIGFACIVGYFVCEATDDAEATVVWGIVALLVGLFAVEGWERMRWDETVNETSDARKTFEQLKKEGKL